jgi:hypothetical protein
LVILSSFSKRNLLGTIQTTLFFRVCSTFLRSKYSIYGALSPFQRFPLILNYFFTRVQDNYSNLFCNLKNLEKYRILVT